MKVTEKWKLLEWGLQGGEVFLEPRYKSAIERILKLSDNYNVPIISSSEKHGAHGGGYGSKHGAHGTQASNPNAKHSCGLANGHHDEKEYSYRNENYEKYISYIKHILALNANSNEHDLENVGVTKHKARELVYGPEEVSEESEGEQEKETKGNGAKGNEKKGTVFLILVTFPCRTVGGGYLYPQASTAPTDASSHMMTHELDSSNTPTPPPTLLNLFFPTPLFKSPPASFWPRLLPETRRCSRTQIHDFGLFLI